MVLTVAMQTEVPGVSPARNFLVPYIVVVFVTYIATGLVGPNDGRTEGPPRGDAILTLLMCAAIIGAAMHVAFVMGCERGERSIEAILGRPHHDQRPLLARWLGALKTMAMFAGALAAGWWLLAWREDLHMAAPPLMTAAAAAYVLFAAALGLWLSAVCHSIMWATIMARTFTSLVLIAPLVFMPDLLGQRSRAFAGLAPSPAAWTYFLHVGLSPVAALSALAKHPLGRWNHLSWYGPDLPTDPLVTAVMEGISVYLIAGLLLYLDAYRRLRTLFSLRRVNCAEHTAAGEAHSAGD
jgi:hypothetical protein